jgi:hypothetical protein
MKIEVGNFLESFGLQIVLGIIVFGVLFFVVLVFMDSGLKKKKTKEYSLIVVNKYLNALKSVLVSEKDTIYRIEKFDQLSKGFLIEFFHYPRNKSYLEIIEILNHKVKLTGEDKWVKDFASRFSNLLYSSEEINKDYFDDLVKSFIAFVSIYSSGEKIFDMRIEEKIEAKNKKNNRK